LAEFKGQNEEKKVCGELSVEIKGRRSGDGLDLMVMGAF